MKKRAQIRSSRRVSAASSLAFAFLAVLFAGAFFSPAPAQPIRSGTTALGSDAIMGASSVSEIVGVELESVDTGQDWNVRTINLTIFNEHGFLPATIGATSSTGRGDLAEIRVILITPGGTEIPLRTYGRGATAFRFPATADSYSITLSNVDEDRSLRPHITRWSGVGTPQEWEVRLDFMTWDFIGDAPDSLTGGENWIGPGDRFRVQFDTVAFTEDTAAGGGSGQVTVNRTTPPINLIYGIPDAGVVTGFGTMIPPVFDMTNSGFNDGNDVDLVPWRGVLGLHLVGGPSNVQRLEEVILNIIHPPGMDLRVDSSPLNTIDNSERSGIQIRRNIGAPGPDRSDFIIPIDIDFFQSSYERGVRMDTVHLRLANPFALSEDEVKFANTTADTTVGTDADFFIALSPSLSAELGDTLQIILPQTGMRLSGVGSRDTELYRLSTSAMIGMPLIYEDFTSQGQFISQSSPPTAIVGLNVRDSGNPSQLYNMWFYVADQNATLTTGDFLRGPEGVDGFSNDVDANGIANSGFAVYRDNVSHPQNNPGKFDPGIDTFVPFRNLGSQTRFFAPTGAEDLNLFQAPAPARVLVAKMEFDLATVDGLIPDFDTGINEGNDFFLVVRTSSSAAPGDEFRIGIMDLNATDPLGQDFHFLSVINNSVFFSFVGQEGSSAVSDGLQYFDWEMSDGFQSELLKVNAPVQTSYENLVPIVRDVFPGNKVAVFGINTVDSGGTFRINQVRVQVNDGGSLTGDFGFDTDLIGNLPINTFKENLATNPITLYLDNGDIDGEFDPSDEPIGGTLVSRESSNGRDTITFNIGGGFDIPDGDSGVDKGNDLFIVVNLSDSVTFKDDFIVRMPDSGVSFTDPTLDVPPAKSSGTLRVGLPVSLKSLTTAGQTISDTGERIAIIGIDAASETFAGNSTVFLDKVRLQIENVSNFSIFDLADLTTDSRSGIAFFADADGDGVFNEAVDSPINLVSLPTIFSPSDFEFDLINDSAVVPNSADGLRTDFFITVKTRAGFAQENDKFTVSIAKTPPGGLTFSAVSDPALTVATNTITVQAAGVSAQISPRTLISPDLDASSTNGFDTTTFSITVPLSSDTSWTLEFTAHSDSSKISITGRGASTVVIGDTQGPTRTDVYDMALDFNDASDSASRFTFGETLVVDVIGIDPDTGPTALPVQTTDTVVSLRVFIDTVTLDTTTDPTLRASGAFENAATIEFYRNGTLIGTGTLSNGAVTQTVSLLSGQNTFTVLLEDRAGNRSNLVTYGTVQFVIGNDNTVIQNLIISNPETVYRGETAVLFGMNLVARTSTSNITLDSFLLQVRHSGTFSAANDLAKLVSADTAGVLLFIDNGLVDGAFDTQDQIVPVDPPSVTAVSGTRTDIRVRPQAGAAVPRDDTSAGNVGFDYYVALTFGDGLLFADSFTVTIPADGLTFSDPFQSANQAETSSLLVGGSVTTLTDSTLATCLPIGSNPHAIFGFNLDDLTQIGTDGGVNLDRVDVILTPDTIFNITDLAALNTTAQSGVAIYRNNGSDSSSLDSGDSLVATSGVTLVSNAAPYRVRVNVDQTDASTALPNSGDTMTDFWVVIRTANLSTQVEKKFIPSIPAGGIVTTDDAHPQTITGMQMCVQQGTATGLLESKVFSPVSSPGFRDTLGIQVDLPIGSNDSRAMTLVLFAGSFTGETAVVKNGFGNDTTFVLSSADSPNWAQNEYAVRILYTSDGGADSTIIDFDDLISVDSFAVPATAASPPSTSATQTYEFTLVADLTLDGGSNTSVDRAKIAGEVQEGFTISIFSTKLDSTVQILHDTFTGPHTEDLNKPITVSLPHTGLQMISVQLTDFVGNSDSTTFNVRFTTTGSGLNPFVFTDANGDEVNEPVFRYSASNPSLTLTFNENLTGGGIGLYNAAGALLTTLPSVPGSASITWNGRNISGGLLKNGVYLMQIQVQLEGGGSVNQVQPIYFLK